MGTRNLTAVYIDGQYKVAQYGQWDGYPECAGTKILEFLKKILNSTERYNMFIEKVKATECLSDEELCVIGTEINSGKLKNWEEKYPELSRDTGCGILDVILDKPKNIKLINSIDFAGDSLFCEFAYVIDFDKKAFECYEGFNQKELTENDRFYFLKQSETIEDRTYYPVKMKAKWSFEKIKDLTKDEFISAFDEEY